MFIKSYSEFQCIIPTFIHSSSDADNRGSKIWSASFRLDQDVRHLFPYINLYGVHLVTTLIKRLIRGTYHGRLEPKYLQNYLDEYAFRFNRRKSKNIGKKFMRIVQQVVRSRKITWPSIQWDMDPICYAYHRS